MTFKGLFRPALKRGQIASFIDRKGADMLEKDTPTTQEKPSPLLRLFREVEQEHDDHIQYLANRRLG